MADSQLTGSVGAQRTGPFWGATWMIGACTMFAVMAVCVRLLKGQQHAVDIVFWRSVMGVVLMFPFMINSAWCLNLVEAILAICRRQDNDNPGFICMGSEIRGRLWQKKNQQTATPGLPRLNGY